MRVNDPGMASACVPPSEGPWSWPSRCRSSPDRIECASILAHRGQCQPTLALMAMEGTPNQAAAGTASAAGSGTRASTLHSVPEALAAASSMAASQACPALRAGPRTARSRLESGGGRDPQHHPHPLLRGPREQVHETSRGGAELAREARLMSPGVSAFTVTPEPSSLLWSARASRRSRSFECE